MPNYYGGPNPVSGMYPPQGATYPAASVTPNSINQYNPQNNVNNLTNVLVVPVNGREGVDSYPVAMGMTVLLMDYANKKFWLKSNDGLSPKIVEHIFSIEGESNNKEDKAPEFVTKKEFLSLKKTVESMNKRKKDSN